MGLSSEEGYQVDGVTPTSIKSERGPTTESRPVNLHSVFQICIHDLQISEAFSRLAPRFANLHRVSQSCTAFRKFASRFADLRREFQICAASCKFASRFGVLLGRFGNLHRHVRICATFFQDCTGFSKFARPFASLHGDLQICMTSFRFAPGFAYLQAHLRKWRPKDQPATPITATQAYCLQLGILIAW